MPEKNYVALGKKNIVSASNSTSPKTILVYARNKKGKSTLCASAGKGNILMLDPERGGVHLKTADPDLWAIKKWDDIDEARGFLATGQHKYTWVGLDGLTQFYGMALNFVVKNREREQNMTVQPGMLTKKDWGQANKVMKAMMHSFWSLGLNVIMTAQERVMENKDREADEETGSEDVSYVADLSAGCRGEAYALADVIGRLYVANVDMPNGSVKKQRRLWISDHPLYDTGGRADVQLPDYIKNPTIARIMRLIG